MAIGLGTCSGPLIGSLLYIVLPYGGVFGCFAALIFFSGLIAAIVVPKRLNAPNVSDSMVERGENHKQITYLRFFTNLSAFLLIVAAIMTMILEYYIDPIIGIELLSLGVSE